MMRALLLPCSPSRRAGWLVAGVLGAAALLLGFRSRPEPRQDGQPLSYYLGGLTYGDLRRERDAAEAIRAIESPVAESASAPAHASRSRRIP